jgi:hypothetical protein
MERLFLAISLLAAPIAAAAQTATPASLHANPDVRAVFDRDWVLMNWALKFYDADHDVLLQPAEAQAAAAEFRKMADSNGDGRITPDEYRSARAFILARY